MDIRQLTDTHAVSEQISASDMATIAAAGFRTVICNRPDSEVTEDLQTPALAAAAAEAGLDYHILELTMQTMTPENVARHGELIAGAEGPVLAYCRSGTRSSIAWALSQAGKLRADEIIARGMAAGYNLENLRPYLESTESA